MRCDAPWLEIALGELGVAEIPGTESNPRIGDYHDVTAAGRADDDVAWCASFTAFCLDACGIPHTRSKSSLSWLDYGKPATCARGAIVVFKRRRGGHVGFVLGVNANGSKVACLGGNQNNQVNVTWYPMDTVRAWRQPEGFELVGPAPIYTGRARGAGSTR